MFEICWIEKSDEFTVIEFMVKKYGFEITRVEKSRIEMYCNLQYGNIIVRID